MNRGAGQFGVDGTRPPRPRRGREGGGGEAPGSRVAPGGHPGQRARSDRGRPRCGKTLIARSFAKVLGLRFSRVQFTPDLMPMDVTGSVFPGIAGGEMAFRPGPIFANLVLADEVNRAPAKTQAALLEAMEERQVTADGSAHPLERPFLVIATQNPIEFEGTYPLPEAELDRFIVRLRVGYPTADEEWQILARRQQRERDEVDLVSVINRQDLLDAQQALETVHVSEDVGRYMVALVNETRNRSRARLGASPRGSLALLKLSRGLALLRGPTSSLPTMSRWWPCRPWVTVWCCVPSFGFKI